MPANRPLIWRNTSAKSASHPTPSSAVLRTVSAPVCFRRSRRGGGTTPPVSSFPGSRRSVTSHGSPSDIDLGLAQRTSTSLHRDPCLVVSAFWPQETHHPAPPLRPTIGNPTWEIEDEEVCDVPMPGPKRTRLTRHPCVPPEGLSDSPPSGFLLVFSCGLASLCLPLRHSRTRLGQ